MPYDGIGRGPTQLPKILDDAKILSGQSHVGNNDGGVFSFASFKGAIIISRHVLIHCACSSLAINETWVHIGRKEYGLLHTGVVGGDVVEALSLSLKGFDVVANR